MTINKITVKGGIIILNSHKVVAILDEPKKMTVGLGDIRVDYWSVLCEMKNHLGTIYETSVTFDNLADAVNLKVGDTFLR